jgi:uncharacterized membrane protein
MLKCKIRFDKGLAAYGITGIAWFISHHYCVVITLIKQLFNVIVKRQYATLTDVYT